MSISSIQKERVFSRFLRELFSSGEQPTFTDVLKKSSEYFSDNPIGQPSRYEANYIGDGARSTPARFNNQMKTTIENLNVLYEAAFEQLETSMMLSTLLRTELDRLSVRRKKLIAKIDDYLFSLYNPDGYYYSISDNFADLSIVDLFLSTAIFDTTTGAVTIPTSSAGSKTLSYGEIQSAEISCSVTGGLTKAPFDVVANFANAVDGLTNTAWIIQLDRETPAPITCHLVITVAGSYPIDVSKIDLTPYGVTPVQVFVETLNATDPEPLQFGNAIKTSTDRMIFMEMSRKVTKMQLTLIKRTPDYTFEKDNKNVYRYVFGIKELALSEYFYDTEAILVSAPLSIDRALVDDHVIDAVSLTAVSDVPPDAEIDFYVAPDIEGNESPALSDFDWKAITPIGQLNQKSNVIVHFDGAASYAKYIKADPTSSELQLIELNDDDPDLQKRNPTQVLIDGVDVYRIASFSDDEPLVGSITLEEGVNTTKIYHLDRDEDALELEFWKNYVNGTATADIVYGHIDTGNDFFYGGDVGEGNKSVYVETYLESLDEQPLIVKPFRKPDPNSRQWTVKVFLNGRQLAYLPVGTDEFLIPWRFSRGLNYISLIIDIPDESGEYPNVEAGTLDLMGDSNLYDFGTVKLANWKYVDFFNMQHNQVGQPQTFTIYNNEIISRRKPTTSFRVKYSKATNQSPTAVRVRADLKRNLANPNISPMLKSYRLRFLYGD